jgi:uncharacterized protein (DUF433 family)
MSTVSVEHIEIDDRGHARIAGSRIKVIHLVAERQANGWTVEELQQAHPHLSLSAIHDAFAYYYDHRELLDDQLKEDFAFAESMRKAANQEGLLARLQAKRDAS